VTAALRSPGSLTVFYDVMCPVCVRCRGWLEGQAAFVPIGFVSSQDAAEAVARGETDSTLAACAPWLGEELVVLGDGGEAWVGPAAFLTCLWATRDYREWSYRLSGPTLAPLAERFFHLISSRRRSIGRVLLGSVEECADGTCRHRR
jgi:predicted DCC family thiol-disulfide oxidoreductase YuxK